MTRLLQTAGIVALLAATLCFLEIAKTARDLSETLGEISLTAQAAQYRLTQLDPLVAKAGRDLDSLDRAIKTHQRLAANLDAALSDPQKGIKPTLQNANAVLVQLGLSSGELTQASIEQRAGLAEGQRKLSESLDEANLLLRDIRARVNDPAVAETQAHLNNALDAIDKALHPPKQTRGQKALGFILQTIFGNAVQGAIRR